MKTEFYDSTIALTAYNWLAMYTGGPASKKAIGDGVRRYYPPKVLVTDTQIDRCLDELERRALVTRIPNASGDEFDVADAQRRPATRKGIADSDDEASGWERWFFFPRARAAQLMGGFEPVPAVRSEP